MEIRLPKNKSLLLSNLIERFSTVSKRKIRDFAKFISSLIAACPAIKYSWLYTKDFERTKFLALSRNNNNYDSVMSLSLDNSLLVSSGNSIETVDYFMKIFSDASRTGWGAVCGSQKTHGFWSESEKEFHINYLELKSAFFGLQCFAKDIRKVNILLRIDNTTAIAYINRMGGIQFENLNRLTKEIWQWCEVRDISVFASYISSEDNCEADFESRRLEPETEYEISSFAFNKITEFFQIPDIDLFASRTNHKCIRYVSWKKDPGSETIDAFTLNWKDFYFYAFPPFSIILKVLRKIRKDKAQGIVVIPDWPAQPWYPLFQSMLAAEPLIFNPNKHLLISCDIQQHPLWRSLSLVVGRLSGRL